VTAYLDRQRIVVEKTGDFTLLFLFSMGVTKGKWGTLVTALLDFKKQYDANAPLEEVLPTLVEAHPDAYRGKGLRDLATDMFEFGRQAGTTRLLDAAYATLPPPVLSPADAYRRLVRGEVEPIPLAAAAGRLAATGIVPYPPGIPLLMPGERFGQADEPQLAYLLALQAFDRRFPGFGHETHGVEIVGGEYRLLCITEKHPARVRRGGKKA
jgi:arginine/lysine/ornithine decarboxylase